MAARPSRSDEPRSRRTLLRHARRSRCRRSLLVEPLEDRRLLAAGWPVQAGGSNPDRATCVATLPDGSAVVGGWFWSGQVSFGDTQLGINHNRAEGFVAKVDRDGSFTWAVDIDTVDHAGYANVLDIAALPDGSAIATGIFDGPVTIGGTTLTSSGTDVFVAKINADGSVAWARSAGGDLDNDDDEGGFGVAALADGSSIVCGNFTGSAEFGGGKIDSGTLYGKAGFVAKYTTTGGIAWARALAASESCRVWDVAALPDGSTIVTGSFTGTAKFGTTTLTSQKNASDKFTSDAFVAKLNPQGAFLWAKRGGGSGVDAGYAVTTMPDGIAYVTGSVVGKATFGSTTAGVNEGETAGFVSKISPDGSFLWSRQVLPALGRSMSGRAISAFPNGSVIVAQRNFNGSDTKLTLNRFKADGTREWSYFWPVTGNAWGVAARADGTAMVVGDFSGTAYFGDAIQLEAPGTSYSSPSDIFVAKISAAGSFDLPPGIPTIVSSTPGNRSVTLNWTAAAGNGHAVTDYIVQYRPAYQGVPQWTTLPNVLPSTATTRTVPGLANGVPYVFRVKAVNSIGAGTFSSQSSLVVPRTLPSAPGKPAGTSGDGRVTLTWAAPASNGGSPITRYEIQYAAQGSIFFTTAAVSPTTTSATVTGLTNGTGYVFRVAAVNAVGTGTFSAVSAAVVPLGLPTAPTGFSVTAGTRSATLSWSSPASDGASPITGYRIRYAQKNGLLLGPWTTTTRSGSGRTITVIDGLLAGGRYVFQIAAVNAVGAGANAVAEVIAGSGR